MKNRFRVWNKITNSFLRNDYFAIDGGGTLIYNWVHNEWIDYIDKSQMDLVIQWFTGLTDPNGKEVYEGDIVCEQYNEETACLGSTANVGQVFFAAGTFMIDGGGPMYDYTHSVTPDRLEDCVVIGNIFENPELLEK